MPRTEVGWAIAVCAPFAACHLDAASKTGCTTNADCDTPHVCVDAVCVARDGASAPTTACRTLANRELLDAATGHTGPEWQAVLVPLPATASCAYMDETEVTVAEYAAWADASGAFADWDARCTGWKTTVSNPAANPDDPCVTSIHADEVDPFAPQKPIRCVDWCDAEAFCRVERGGHLCYATVSGGSSQPENEPDEWPSACSNGDTTVWPWGDDSGAMVCNFGQPAAGCVSTGFSCGVAPVASYPGCVNEAGIYDLVGNVREWLGVCAAVDAASPDGTCSVRGGGYDDVLTAAGCGNLAAEPKSQRLPDLGFRCCYALTAAQREMAGLP